MRRNLSIVFPLFFAVLCMNGFYASTVSAANLTVKGANIPEVQGTFTLILYGGRYFRDVESVAILDLEGDQYTFEPYAPAFDYRVLKGLPAKEALADAESFLRSHYDFWRTQLRKVLDENGKIIGFEIRPLYYPFVFGVSDVVDINYGLKESKVRGYINLKPEVWRKPFGDGGNSRDR